MSSPYVSPLLPPQPLEVRSRNIDRQFIPAAIAIIMLALVALPISLPFLLFPGPYTVVGLLLLATLGFLSQRMGDRFGGLMMLPDRIKRLPARSGRTALYGMLRQMLTEPIVPDNAPGDLELVDGIEQMARSQRRRGMRVVVSDFLTAGEAELDIGARPALPTRWLLDQGRS